jgi:hypothetical protein
LVRVPSPPHEVVVAHEQQSASWNFTLSPVQATFGPTECHIPSARWLSNERRITTTAVPPQRTR